MEHFSIYLIVLWFIFLAFRRTRSLAWALAPWLVFAICYDGMRLYPNYKVNVVDIQGLYDAEKELFGVNSEGVRMILGEYFNIHHASWADFLAGCFYLCWVPVPMGYALWLWSKGKGKESARMAIAFLWVNIIGFVVYYIHPAAPPWYVLDYGFDPLYDVPGDTGGLARFDALVHIPIFGSIYSGNSNIFAAIPSLHSAYLLTAAIYVVINKGRRRTAAFFFFLSVGIWCTAVYTCHHYVIDVLLGIADAVVGIILLECVVYRIPFVRRGCNKYVRLLEGS